MIDGKTVSPAVDSVRPSVCLNVPGLGLRRSPVITSDLPTRAPGSTNHGIFCVRPVAGSRYLPTRSRKRPSRASYFGEMWPLNGPARITPPVTGVAAHAGGDSFAVPGSCAPAASCPVSEPQAAIATVRLTSAPARAGNVDRFTRRDYAQDRASSNLRVGDGPLPLSPDRSSRPATRMPPFRLLPFFSMVAVDKTRWRPSTRLGAGSAAGLSPS